MRDVHDIFYLYGNILPLYLISFMYLSDTSDKQARCSSYDIETLFFHDSSNIYNMTVCLLVSYSPNFLLLSSRFRALVFGVITISASFIVSFFIDPPEAFNLFSNAILSLSILFFLRSACIESEHIKNTTTHTMRNINFILSPQY